MLEEDTYTERDISAFYPDDSKVDYQKKMQGAKETDNVFLPLFGNQSTVYSK